MEDEMNPFASYDVSPTHTDESTSNIRKNTESDRSGYKTTVKSVSLSSPDPLSAMLSSSKSLPNSQSKNKNQTPENSKKSLISKSSDFQSSMNNNEAEHPKKTTNQLSPNKLFENSSNLNNASENASYPEPSENDKLLNTKPSSKTQRTATSSGKLNENSFSAVEKPRYKFEVSVTSPRKVNDVINPFTVYKITTKTDSPIFKKNQFSVSRRFRDFLWLYDQLIVTHPGIVVPPPPEKHAIGRFQDDFIESRRLALEKMVRKIVAHPQLSSDSEVKIFLESDSFVNDSSNRRKESPKGFFKILGDVVSGATSSFVKLPEPDEWFETRRHQLDQLEAQLKALYKSIDLVAKQRKELGACHLEFGDSMLGLANAEINQTLSKHFMDLGNLQKQIQEIHEKQSKVDLATMATSAEEYLRLVNVIRGVLITRSKSYSNWQSLNNELEQKQASFLKNQSKLRLDKVTQTEKELNQLELRAEEAKREFENLTKLVRSELEKFDREKVEDFQKSVEGFLSGVMTNQEEIVQLWEGFIASLKLDENEVKSVPKSSTQQTCSPEVEGKASCSLEAEAISPYPTEDFPIHSISPELKNESTLAPPPEDPSVSVWDQAY